MIHSISSEILLNLDVRAEKNKIFTDFEYFCDLAFLAFMCDDPEGDRIFEDGYRVYHYITEDDEVEIKTHNKEFTFKIDQEVGTVMMKFLGFLHEWLQHRIELKTSKDYDSPMMDKHDKVCSVFFYDQNDAKVFCFSFLNITKTRFSSQGKYFDCKKKYFQIITSWLYEICELLKIGFTEDSKYLIFNIDYIADLNLIPPLDISPSFNFHSLYTNKILTDFTIIHPLKTWSVHKIILYTSGSFFTSLFNNNFQEHTTSIIKLDQFSAESLDFFVNFIYHNIDSSSTLDLTELFEMAKFFGNESLYKFVINQYSLHANKSHIDILTKLDKMYPSRHLKGLIEKL